jgi:hypothetical protein
MQYHNIFFTSGGIRTLTHHVNVAHVTREPEQQNNGYPSKLLPITTLQYGR